MRRYEFDNLKGIMIFFVVLGHLTTLSAQETDFCSISCMNTIINSFHMPVFAFVSGLFSKKQIDEKESNKIISNILLPYFIFNLIHWIISSRNIFAFFNAQWTMWYLISLFFWKLLSIPFSKLRFSFLWVMLLSVLAGFIENGATFAVIRTTAFFPFFYAGFSLGIDRVTALRRKTKSYKLIAVVVLIICFVLVGICYYKGIPEELFYLRESYLSIGVDLRLALVFRCAATIISFVEVFCCIVIIPDKNTYLSSIGANSIVIYLSHSFIVSALRKITLFNSANIVSFLVLIIFTAAIICVLFGSNFVAKIYKTIINGCSKLVVDNSRG